jgi:hypothetical protein
MRDAIRTFLVTLGLLATVAPMAAVGASAGGGTLPFGDGMAAIERYDVVTKRVAIGKLSVGLLPSAASSLDAQLARHGLAAGRPFGAKFNVVRDAAGQPVIESIYVFPPSKK